MNSELAAGEARSRYVVYRLLRRLLRFATQVFFRNIEVVGRDTLPNPNNSAVVFCGNHPNSLLDPVLITAWCGRIVHFAAKDVLFAVPILGWLLRLMGAVPIRRRQDHGGGVQSNADAFSELTAVLRRGGAMGIFPEGVSHDASQLVPLKTGAARLALGATQSGGTVPVYLVPVGLVYFTRNRFRSSVLVQFGAPIEITAQENLSEEQASEEVRRITSNLDQRIRSLTINAETWENIWVLDGVRRLYQPADIDLQERARLSRAFNQLYRKVAKEPDVANLYDEVRDYLLRLSADNLNDRLVAQGLTVLGITLRVIAHLTLLFVSLPLFVIGAPIFIPLGLLLKIAGVAISPRSDTVATTKFAFGLFVLTTFYAGALVWVFWSMGLWYGLIAAALIPAAGGATIHVIARVNAVKHLVLTTIRIFTLRRELEALRTQRASLVVQVQGIVDKYQAQLDEESLA